MIKEIIVYSVSVDLPILTQQTVTNGLLLTQIDFRLFLLKENINY